MYCLVVGQALGTLKPLVTLGALVEPLLFIGASEVRAPAGKKLIVPQSETCSRGRNQKLNHACFWKIYIAPASEIQLVWVVRLWIRAAGQVDCGTPSCALQGYFQWIPLSHIADMLSFLRALPRGSSDSGRKRRTFHIGCSEIAWAPDSNNILLQK